ncbi:MAG TPA: hypothetical protein PKA59_08835 [Chakrabartia sp.]|mgnify:CR=1 FL=1|jgi:hypothetical protein|nr:hypothetical protein [Chakrabartia sp.]
MTKHIQSNTHDGRDRSALEILSEPGESYESVVRDYRQSLERLKDALILEGLSFSEAYIEGRAGIAVEFGPHSAFESNGPRLISVWRHYRQPAKSAPDGVSFCVENIKPIDHHQRVGSDENMMLIGNIKSMDPVKFIPVNLERLYFIEDETDHDIAGEASCFLSIQGCFRVLPRVPKRELSPSIDGAIIGFDQSTVSVVQGSAKVVDGVTDDGRCMAGNPTSEDSFFPTVRIGLGPQSFDVVHHVGANNRFKLLDVMIGPFYF